MADLVEKNEGAVAASPSSGSIAEASGINEKRLLRKLDYRLLPPLTLLYLLSFLDRSNGASGFQMAFPLARLMIV